MRVHGHLYTKRQEVLLKGIGKKKNAESRWLALYEVMSGEEHRGKVDPCGYPFHLLFDAILGMERP
jgi:hypothetical protein